MADANRRFDDLCRRHTDRLVRDLVHYGNLEQDAREVVQEALLAVWKRIETLEIAPEAEWVYLRTAARRLLINRRRELEAIKRGGGKDLSLDDLTHAPADEAMSAEERLIRSEESERFRHAFHAAMSELPPESQQYLVLRQRGFGPNEIAKKVGVQSTEVRSRLMRANKFLRERVGPPPAGVNWSELTGENDDHQE